MELFEYQDENCRGRIERFDYIGTEGAKKYALVYLPEPHAADRSHEAAG